MSGTFERTILPLVFTWPHGLSPSPFHLVPQTMHNRSVALGDLASSMPIPDIPKEYSCTVPCGTSLAYGGRYTLCSAGFKPEYFLVQALLEEGDIFLETQLGPPEE